MLKRLLLAAIFACGLAVPAWSQSNVIVNYKNGTTGPGTQVTPSTPLPIFSGFTQTGRPSDLSVTNTTGSEALGATGQVVRACNIGSNTAYVALGDSTVTATATGSIPVLAGTCASLNIGTATYIAAITSASTTTIQVSVGYGVAALGGGGGVGYTPSGAAGGVLSGTYPNPGFAASPSFTGTATFPDAGTWSSTGISGTTVTANTAFVSLAYNGVNASGTNATATGGIFTNSLSTGNATNPDLVFQTGVKVASGSGLATATTAVTIKGETQAVDFAGPANWQGNTGIDKFGNLGVRSAPNGSYPLYVSGGSYFGGVLQLAVSGSGVILNGVNTATLQLGAANAASPVAQTLQVQGSRAGTDSNVAGANLTIQPGTGTGTGASSALKINAPIGAASGSGAQTQTLALSVIGAANGQLPSVIVGGSAANATNATDGFLYIPTTAGQPTGTPTTQGTVTVAIQYDTTNHQFWIYDGGWKQPKTPAAAATVTWQ